MVTSGSAERGSARVISAFRAASHACGSDSRRMILSMTSSVGGDPVLCRFYIIKQGIDSAELVDPAADDTRSRVEDVPGMSRGQP